MWIVAVKILTDESTCAVADILGVRLVLTPPAIQTGFFLAVVDVDGTVGALPAVEAFALVGQRVLRLVEGYAGPRPAVGPVFAGIRITEVLKS